MSKHPSLRSAPRPSGGPGASRPRAAAAAAWLTGAALALGLQAGGARADVLYILDTKCALGGAAPVACRVEALNEAGATLYRHTIGTRAKTLRISDQPARFTLWDGASNSWRPLRNAAVRFSTNTLCLNDTDLCVVNPNYLNSLLQERPDFRGRDLVRVHFAANGRVDILCYDTGCNLISARREGN
ncbi:MAG: hypothetical protein ACK6BG_11210 [Cyanobacteriota bacterium]